MNRKLWISFLIVCLAAGAAWFFVKKPVREGSDVERRQMPSAPVVAEVNGQPILAREFEERASEVLLRLGASGAHKAEVVPALKRSILEEMIRRLLLLQEAARRGIAVSDDELERVAAELWYEGAQEEAPGPGEERVDKAEWTEKLREMLILDKLMESTPGGRAQVTEEDISSYYEEYSENYQLPHRVRLFQIMVDSEEKAKGIHQKLIEGADFGELARSESLSPEGNRGGEMGVFAEADLPAVIEREVFRLKVEQLSRVVKSDYGYHIFKVAEILPAKRLALDEVRQEIAKTLLSERQHQLFQDWLDGLRDAAAVTIHEDVLSAARLPLGAGGLGSVRGKQAHAP